MKDNKILYIVLGVIGLCVLLVLASAGILWFSVADSAPWVQNENGYYVRITRVYYLPGSLKDPWQVIGAHAPSFEVIDSYYGYDKEQAYFKGVAIPGSDPAENIFYYEQTIVDADVDSFLVIGSWGNYSGDENHIYWQGVPIQDADPATFKLLEEITTCSADSEHVYFMNEILTGADPSDPENAKLQCLLKTPQ